MILLMAVKVEECRDLKSTVAAFTIRMSIFLEFTGKTDMYFFGFYYKSFVDNM